MIELLLFGAVAYFITLRKGVKTAVIAGVIIAVVIFLILACVVLFFAGTKDFWSTLVELQTAITSSLLAGEQNSWLSVAIVFMPVLGYAFGIGLAVYRTRRKDRET